MGCLNYAIADLIADDQSFFWVLYRDSQWAIFTVIPEVLALKGKIYCKGYPLQYIFPFNASTSGITVKIAHWESLYSTQKNDWSSAIRSAIA